MSGRAGAAVPSRRNRRHGRVRVARLRLANACTRAHRWPTRELPLCCACQRMHRLTLAAAAVSSRIGGRIGVGRASGGRARSRTGAVAGRQQRRGRRQREQRSSSRIGAGAGGGEGAGVAQWPRRLVKRDPLHRVGHGQARGAGAEGQAARRCRHAESAPPRAAATAGREHGGPPEARQRRPRRGLQGAGGGDDAAAAPPRGLVRRRGRRHGREHLDHDLRRSRPGGNEDLRGGGG
mmetsp:Transcript_45749/g.127522  ORF Transcript_45749/g.127522 Transcript_45749/m.127522 type:complete len:236 (-) Transcript_45749:222-929(-)